MWLLQMHMVFLELLAFFDKFRPASVDSHEPGDTLVGDQTAPATPPNNENTPSLEEQSTLSRFPSEKESVHESQMYAVPNPIETWRQEVHANVSRKRWPFDIPDGSDDSSSDSDIGVLYCEVYSCRGPSTIDSRGSEEEAWPGERH